jgi:hypothetical protein
MEVRKFVRIGNSWYVNIPYEYALRAEMTRDSKVAIIGLKDRIELFPFHKLIRKEVEENGRNK